MAEEIEEDGQRRRRTLRDRASELVHDSGELAEVLVLVAIYGVVALWAAFWIGLALRVVLGMSGIRE